jgi:hypothetical protein
MIASETAMVEVSEWLNAPFCSDDIGTMIAVALICAAALAWLFGKRRRS